MGYLPIYVPREIIHAAGMLPVGIMAVAAKSRSFGATPTFQSYICQIPRSTIELALTGRLDLLDGFLFPSIATSFATCRACGRSCSPTSTPSTSTSLRTTSATSAGKFYQHELNELRNDMQELSGNEITDDALRASIALFNENRAVVGELEKIRNETPWVVPAHEVYLVMHAATILPVDEHTQLVRDYLKAATAEDRPMRDQTRVVSVGSFCEQPPLNLIKTLELAGCYIVWDDLSLGRRWFNAQVSEEGDPIAALSDAFLKHSSATASRYEPEEKKGDYLVQIVKKTGAEGVVFAARASAIQLCWSSRCFKTHATTPKSVDGFSVRREPGPVPSYS